MTTDEGVGHHSKAGFTLLEMLAALAITALIIMSVGALINHVALSFDRGISGVTEAERFALAMDRLASDFAGAHFVSLPGDVSVRQEGGERKDGSSVAFAALANKITFVSSGLANGAGAEVVTLTIEPLDGDRSQLVRRRASWSGPGTNSLQEAAADTVVLISGRYELSFDFGSRRAEDGTVIWTDSWIGRATLPRFIRLNYRDASTGRSLGPRAEFVVRADAPWSCASGNADCLPKAGG
jgi:prepilin-type N-terminal cleavage/methylation domain-containing protein